MSQIQKDKMKISYIEEIKDNICLNNIDFIFNNILKIGKSIIIYYTGIENIKLLKEELKIEYDNFKKEITEYLKKRNISFNDFYFYRYEDQKRLLKNFNYVCLNKRFNNIFLNEINLHFQKYNKLNKIMGNIRICKNFEIKDCYIINDLNKDKIILDKETYQKNENNLLALNYEFYIYTTNYLFVKIDIINEEYPKDFKEDIKVEI